MCDDHLENDLTGDSHLHESRQYWDQEAERFDDEPDHGLNDPVVVNAWTGLLQEWLPITQAKVLDIGCGTGSMSLVLARLGHQVTGIDLSHEMIARAKVKAAEVDHQINFQIMEASKPQLPGQKFDGILCRHLLWALPNPVDVLARWMALLKPGGYLLLIEGYWHNGGGLHAEEVIRAIPTPLVNISIQNLSDRTEFWGQELSDERYVIMAERIIGSSL